MFTGKSILLGISGGIAGYKAAELVRCLTKAGATVQVVMTENAQRFITPLTLAALSGQPVATDMWNLGFESRIGHIELARNAQLVVLAPATANLIAKMAAGIADDYLTTLLLATTAPILVCPAMNCKMYENPVTQRNIEILRNLGHYVLEPDSGILACKEEGVGRLPDPPIIMEAAIRLLTEPTLKGKKVLVSAGPTQEPFDPVRFITNASSGKMGYALAAVASRRSAEVHLVSGPSALSPPPGVNCYKVATAVEMKESVTGLAPEMDVIIMAAAVSDYRPIEVASQKIKKSPGRLTVELERNPDILASLGESRAACGNQVLIGFAAETESLIKNATQKLKRKNLDMIIANDLTEPGAGVGCDTNLVRIIDRTGTVTELPLMSKEQVAEQIWDRAEQLLANRASHGKT
ncbi:MAG: bifunctional phosphopantothenoylcysteine decarboxylase/phosphopantothenate--cysteine ligase CoaBC [Syntrophobacteraceae bacterium]